MIRIHTTVLNGMPVAVEAEWNTDRYGEITIEDITVCWPRPNKLNAYKHAKVLEDKMASDDWDRLEEELLEEFYYDRSWYE